MNDECSNQPVLQLLFLIPDFGYKCFIRIVLRSAITEKIL